MPGLDIGHIVLVMGIALLIFGPERIQEFARTAGHTLTDFQRSAQGLPPLFSDPSEADSAELEVVDEGELEPGTMTPIEHLNEFRSRLIKAVIPVLVLAGVCFFFSDFILRLLKAPAGAGFTINAFGPMDGFVIKWKVALVTAVILASPNLLYQLIAFISPGLTDSERRFLVPAVAAVGVLFVLGALFGYVLLSGMLRVMFTMFGSQINYLPNANQYISFVLFFMLATGLVFELPAVLLTLVRFHVIEPSLLRRQRKIAYFLLFVFAEIITPVADPILAPMIVMAPLVILYEGAIFATRWVLPSVEPQPAATSGGN
jgi:sec-independent protein translocase protein TatC